MTNGSASPTSTLVTIGSGGEVQINNNTATAISRLFHTTTDATIGIATGQITGSLFIGTASTRTSAIQIGATGCNTVSRGPLVGNLGITTTKIDSITPANTFDILPSHIGPITIGNTSSSVTLGNTVFGSSITAPSSSSIINLFNNISGITGKVNMCTSLIFGEDSIASTVATDAISLFKNITTGSITMATNLLLKQNNIDATASNSTFNLFSTITTGDLFIMRNSTNGAINIGNAGATTGNGGGVNIGTGRRNNITIGSSFNNLTDINNGCCTIRKLRVGDAGSGYRCVIVGTVGAGLSGLQTHIMTGAPSGMGNPIVIGQIVNVDNNNYIYVPNISVSAFDRFTYRKKFYTGTSIGDASVESINFVAYWL
jgi:hypothetical protein